MKTSVILLVLGWAFPGLSLGQCPDGWHLFGNLCYSFSSIKLSHSAAKFRCESFGNSATLAAASSDEINSFLPSIAPDLTTSWLGGIELPNGEWVWTDGSTWNDENWAIGRPNLAGQNCLATQNRRDSVEALIWKDTDCDIIERNYYCQIPVLTPTDPINIIEEELAVTDAECQSIICGADCSGDCGWSTELNRCALNHVTRGMEFFAGQCHIADGTTTDEPDIETTTEIIRNISNTIETTGAANLEDDECRAILCARNCNFPCGWSSNLGACAHGHFTLGSELDLGICVTAAPTAAPTIAFVPTSPMPSTSPSSAPTSTSPSVKPTTTEPSPEPTIEPTSSEPSPGPTSSPSSSNPTPVPTAPTSPPDDSTQVGNLGTSTCGWESSMSPKLTAGSNMRPANLFKSNVRVGTSSASQSDTTLHSFTDECVCSCSSNVLCKEAAVRVVGSSFICTLMSEGGPATTTSLNVRSFILSELLTTAPPAAMCNWSTSLEEISATSAGLRPVNLFKSAPGIRLASYTIDPGPNAVDQCLCDCESRESCITAAIRSNDNGAKVCVLMTDGGGSVTTTLNVASYRRIDAQQQVCNWESVIAMQSRRTSAIRPQNLFNQSARIRSFSQNAQDTNWADFSERCVCDCSTTPTCEVAAIRPNNQNQYVCVLMTDGGPTVSTGLLVDVYSRAARLPDNCSASFTDVTVQGKRPANLFAGGTKVGTFRTDMSEISEEHFILSCGCACNDLNTCTAAAIRTSGSNFVCTMLTSSGGMVSTSLSITSLLKQIP